MDTKTLVQERGKTHGNAEASFTAIRLMEETLKGLAPHEGPNMFQHTRYMILTKLARTMQSPEEKDHWKDVQGYAELALQQIEGVRFTPKEELPKEEPTSVVPGYIYLIGPYSHPKADVEAARATIYVFYAQHLMSQGLPVISPITYGLSFLQFGTKGDFETWRFLNEALVSSAKFVQALRLPGFEQSKGVEAEIKLARSLGITEYYVTSSEIYAACRTLHLTNYFRDNLENSIKTIKNNL